MIYVYVLRSELDGRVYVGITKDISRRLKEHNRGKTKSTKGFIPWVLLFYEIKSDYQSARNREKYLKSGFGKQWIKHKWPRSSAG